MSCIYRSIMAMPFADGGEGEISLNPPMRTQHVIEHRHALFAPLVHDHDVHNIDCCSLTFLKPPLR